MRIVGCPRLLTNGSLTIGHQKGCYHSLKGGRPTKVSVTFRIIWRAIFSAIWRDRGRTALYINCEVAPHALEDTVRGGRAMGWVGFNCSIPHEVAVIEHLDALGDSAALIGAVNCVVRQNQRYVGENTDGQGLLRRTRRS
jgi:shikimate 5-dehydrogenase